MVALELAHLLRPDTLILISAPANHRSLRRARLAHKLTHWLPDRLLTPLTCTVGTRLIALADLAPSHASLLADMAHNVATSHLPWALPAIARYHPRPPPQGIPTLQIHGSRDPLIPLPNRQSPPTDRVTVVVRNAGHLLPLTHPKLLAESIEDFIAANFPIPA